MSFPVSMRTVMSSKLYKPIQVGDMLLKHRAVMAPMTRFRVDDAHVPLPNVAEYYRQRSSTPGTLLISEATLVNNLAGGYDHIPGIYTDEQIASWKKVADAVHAQGSYIYLQPWALRRAAEPSVLEKEGGFPYVSASNIPLSSHPASDPKPRSLEISEIKDYMSYYATAAHNAVHRAGFDGVEIHGANGYLPDQFTQSVSNDRTDEYGGSPEKRVKFTLEVVTACVDAVGARKVGLRISPWVKVNDMGGPDPRPTFTILVKKLRAQHPSLAFLHLIEPRIESQATILAESGIPSDYKVFSSEIRTIWGSGDGDDQPRLLSSGDYTKSMAETAAETRGDLIAFGTSFIANPDLPVRLQNNIQLNKGDRSTYYAPVDKDIVKGYTDYKFAKDHRSLTVSDN